MNITLFWILLSTFLVSLIAFIGILALAIKEKLLKKIIFLLIALSAGALMGDAFLHLIPEAIGLSNKYIFLYILVGFITFFLIEKILHWRHCHDGKCPVHTFAYINLIGESVHNFIDGLIIAASFIINTPLGIATTIAIALHEIPQEIGDFGVLVHGGFEKTKALFLNFLVALTAIFGGLIGFYLSNNTQTFIELLIPFTAGGFIYIAASDLIPELKKEVDNKKSLLNFIAFIFGTFLMYLLTFISI